MNEVKLTAWIARDGNGSLYLYCYEPIKYNSVESWFSVSTSYSVLRISDSLFPEIKWSDKEPTEVKVTIKIKE